MLLGITALVLSVTVVGKNDARAGGPPFWGYAITAEGISVSNATVYFCYSQSAFPLSSCTPNATSATYYTDPGGGLRGGSAWAPTTVWPQGYYRIWATRDGVTSSVLNYRYLGSGDDSRYAGDLIFSSLPASPEIHLSFIGWSFVQGSSGFAGSQINFSAITNNTGNANAPATTVRLRLDVNNDGTWETVTPSTMSVMALPSGWGEQKTWSSAWTSVAGLHGFEICIDIDNTAKEFDELNNCQYMRFEIANSVDVSGIPDGALIRATGDIDVYIVKYVGAKKFKRLILSPSVFNSYGHLRWEDIHEVSPSVRDALTTSNLVRAIDDPKTWALYPSGDTGTKSWVASAESFTAHGLDWDSIYEINTVDRDSYTIGYEYAEG